MMWLPGWIRQFGAVGALQNAAAECAARQQTERILDARLEMLMPQTAQEARVAQSARVAQTARAARQPRRAA